MSKELAQKIEESVCVHVNLHQMDEYSIPEAPDLSVLIHRSRRARRLTLRVSSVDGRAKVTSPDFIAETHINAVILKNESWLREKLGAVPTLIDVTIGTRIQIEGQEYLLSSHSKRAVCLSDELLLVPERSSLPNRSVLAYLKELFRDRVTYWADLYTKKRGTQYTKVTLRDTRSRWGSCTDRGGLMFSWRLIMAPPAVLQYVVAHEVAHLEEMNHSKAFWSITKEPFLKL